jgi:hypothetical protein
MLLIEDVKLGLIDPPFEILEKTIQEKLKDGVRVFKIFETVEEVFKFRGRQIWATETDWEERTERLEKTRILVNLWIFEEWKKLMEIES